MRLHHAFIYHTTERHQDPSERSAKTQHRSWHLVQRPPHSIMGAAAKRPACVSHHPTRRVSPRHAGNDLQGNANKDLSSARNNHRSLLMPGFHIHSVSSVFVGLNVSLKVTGVVNSNAMFLKAFLRGFLKSQACSPYIKKCIRFPLAARRIKMCCILSDMSVWAF